MIFSICYFGTLAVIGLSAPGNSYSRIVDQYLNFADWLRKALLSGTKLLLYCFGVETYQPDAHLLRIRDGHGIRIVYSCLGYGIMSFWIAFIAANTGNITKKIKWILGGLVLIFIINVSRLSLLIVAANNHWAFPLFNHHMWFNITAYIFIFLLIYFYDKSEKAGISNY